MEKPKGRRGRWRDWKACEGPAGGRAGSRCEEARGSGGDLARSPGAASDSGTPRGAGNPGGGASGLWAGRGRGRRLLSPKAAAAAAGRGGRPRWRPRGRGSASARRQLGCRWPGGSRGGGGGGGESPWLGAALAAGGGERGPSLPAPASRGRAAPSSQWGGGREKRGEVRRAEPGPALPGRTLAVLRPRGRGVAPSDSSRSAEAGIGTGPSDPRPPRPGSRAARSRSALS